MSRSPPRAGPTTSRSGTSTSSRTRRSTSRTVAVKKTYRVDLVEGDERADLWQLAVDTWDTYASYQRKTEREIPVFKLTPLDG